MATDDSIDMIRRIKTGDESAWEEFYLRFRDRLLCSIRSRLGEGLRRHVESEDVLQSVVREAIEGIEHFDDRGAGSFSRYLHVCILNKIRGKAAYFGAAKRSGGVSLSASLAERLPVAGPDGLRYLEAELFERLERGIRALPERSREVLLMRLVEGLDNTEVAEALSMSKDAASKLYTRSLARLSIAAGHEGSPR